MKAKNAGSNQLDRTGFPFNVGKAPSRQELLSLVPRQELVDLLVDGFFRNYDPIFRMYPIGFALPVQGLTRYRCPPPAHILQTIRRLLAGSEPG